MRTQIVPFRQTVEAIVARDRDVDSALDYIEESNVSPREKEIVSGWAMNRILNDKDKK